MDQNNDKIINKLIKNIKVQDINYKVDDLKCAPGLRFSQGSCKILPILVEYAKAWNKYYHQNKILLSETIETLKPKAYKIYLVNELTNRIGDRCYDQQCWSTLDFTSMMDQKKLDIDKKYIHRPKGPEGKFEWLTNINIDNVMKQYEYTYPEFRYIGTVPMDFAEINSFNINNIDFSTNYSNNIYKYGIVFNLDDHDQGGSHWVSMYFNLKEGQIYYFDSVGIAPEVRVTKFMRKVARWIEKNTDHTLQTIDSKYNKFPHQQGDSECGVYSLYFIAKFLEGKTYDDLTKKRISDKEINRYRIVFFRNTKI